MLKSTAPQNNSRNYAITELCWIGKLHVSLLGGASYSERFPKITQSAILHAAGRRKTGRGDAAGSSHSRGVQEVLHPAGSTALALAPAGTSQQRACHWHGAFPTPRTSSS